MSQVTITKSTISGASLPDMKTIGNGDLWQLLCKASSKNEGWMKSTKAMDVRSGCLVQVTTQQLSPDGRSYALAEAITFVPGVRILNDENNGRKLVFPE